MSENFLTVHLSFYQPPRENPTTGRIGSERSAAPYRNWHERAAEEVYRPNAKIGNFEQISFNMGDELLQWLRTHTTETYKRIVAAANAHRQTHGVGNVLAMPLYAAPLPSLGERDRALQIHWGAEATKQRFGAQPKGFYLPDFAADNATLQALVEAGFHYTLLRESQVEGLPTRGGAGPYRINLPSGDSIDAFIVNESLSRSILDEMVERGGAGFWARNALASHSRLAGRLTLISLEGELVGKHNMAEAQFIRYLFSHEAPSVAYKPITLEAYYQAVRQPVAEIGLRDYVPEPLNETQKLLLGIVAGAMQTANTVLAAAVGADFWYGAERLFSPEASEEMADLHSAYIALQRAWANTLGLAKYPQLAVDHVIYELALADVLLQNNLQAALGVVIAPPLSEHLQEKYTRMADMIQERLKVRTGVNNAYVGD